MSTTQKKNSVRKRMWSGFAGHGSGNDSSHGGDDEQSCFRSTERSIQCQTGEDGKMKCEELKRIWKHCPGRQPEELSVERSELQGDEVPNFGGFGFSFGGHGL